MNQASFLAEQRRYFAASYDEFLLFGGPSIYFHTECLRAGRVEFLGERQIETLYATLTAWGMHRMGDPKRTKTKLTDWQRFSDSIVSQGTALQQFLHYRMIDMPEREYSDALMALKPCYAAFSLSVSSATIVVNSKAVFHLFPEFIPLIDRQYTIRFFTQLPDHWRDSNGKFKVVSLPTGFEPQFKMFHRLCVDIKRLADQVQPSILERERQQHGVTPPKALDNAIVSYIKIVSETGRGL